MCIRDSYGRDKLFTAVRNLICLIYEPEFLLPLFDQENSCNYLFIGSRLPRASWQALYTQAQELLNVSISARLLFSFSSMEQLRTGNSFHKIMGLTDADLKNSLSPDEADTSLIGIQKAIAYMKKHYAEDLTREHIAKEVYMSSSHFSRCFKMVTNTSYTDYLIELRMQKAMELLQDVYKRQVYG